MPIPTETGLKLTYEDYAVIPNDGRRHEIIDGSHFVNPVPRPGHQIIVGNLLFALRTILESGCGEVLPSPIDVHLTEFDIVQPDVIAIASGSAHLIGEIKI